MAQDFLKRVLGPIGDEAGRAIAHPLREWNEKRVRLGMQTLESAAAMLDEAGRSASPVPGRVLFPLLQAASIKEHEQLRRMWVTLLANSADSARRADMLPAFVSILKELSPVEAAVLEGVYWEELDGEHRVTYLPDTASARFNPDTMKVFVGADSKSLREVALPFKNYRVMTDNLARLGLVEVEYSGTAYGTTFSTRVYSGLKLTALGHQFVRACVLKPESGVRTGAFDDA